MTDLDSNDNPKCFVLDGQRDLVATAVQSPAWLSAISRTIVRPYPQRQLDAYLSVDSLLDRLTYRQRQVVVVEANTKNFGRCCRLGQARTQAAEAVLLIAIATGATAEFRHGLRVSGFGVILRSFTELAKLRITIERFTAQPTSDPPSIEAAVQLSLPW